MSQAESTMKTPPSTTKRFHFNMLVNNVLKLFPSSKHHQQEKNHKPRNCTNEFIFDSLFFFLYI